MAEIEIDLKLPEQESLDINTPSCGMGQNINLPVNYIATIQAVEGIHPSTNVYLPGPQGPAGPAGPQGPVGIGVQPLIMSGATFNSNGTSGLVPQPISGDQKKYLRGDGTWHNVRIEDIQLVSGSNITLNANDYSIFLTSVTGSSTFSYSGFDPGKSINVYLIPNHTGHLPHTFPENTIFSELGDANIIYSFNGYMTRILLQNIGENVVNFSSVVKITVRGGSPGGSDGGGDGGIGLSLLDWFTEQI